MKQVGKALLGVLDGRLNTQIAFDISEVKMHRDNAMCKLATTSIGHLVPIREASPVPRRTGAARSLSVFFDGRMGNAQI